MWFTNWVFVASLLLGSGAATGRAAEPKDAVLASGKLESRLLAGSLFHIDEFWIRVAADTEFNRWLSQGLNHNAVVMLTSNADRFGDQKNMRILTGRLNHETAAKLTPTTTDVVGRLPRGDSGLVHTMFIKDELTGSLGAATFETADLVVASAFDKYEGAHVSVVIAIETREIRRR